MIDLDGLPSPGVPPLTSKLIRGLLGMSCSPSKRPSSFSPRLKRSSIVRVRLAAKLPQYDPCNSTLGTRSRTYRGPSPHYCNSCHDHAKPLFISGIGVALFCLASGEHQPRSLVCLSLPRTRWPGCDSFLPRCLRYTIVPRAHYGPRVRPFVCGVATEKLVGQSYCGGPRSGPAARECAVRRWGNISLRVAGSVCSSLTSRFLQLIILRCCGYTPDTAPARAKPDLAVYLRDQRGILLSVLSQSADSSCTVVLGCVVL
ncbi:hypothetical protein C8F01DRAFT_93058 [Mycena amicta]|nr:hypothetical protein C8F01DRAFT_93058 [Mycena amicta]